MRGGQAGLPEEHEGTQASRGSSAVGLRIDIHALAHRSLWQELTATIRLGTKRGLGDVAARGLPVPKGAGRGAHYELPEKRLGNGSNGSADGGQGGNGSIGAVRLRIRIRDPVAASLGLQIDDFDLPPFSQQGGLGRVHQLFGAELAKVTEELNRELVA